VFLAAIAAGSCVRRAIVERRFAGTCGDGTRDPGEDCDGSGCPASCCFADADGDGSCDGVDPCAAPSVVEPVRISGSMMLAGSADPPLDPVAHGSACWPGTPRRAAGLRRHHRATLGQMGIRRPPRVACVSR
jgi:hypothetical protein